MLREEATAQRENCAHTASKRRAKKVRSLTGENLKNFPDEGNFMGRMDKAVLVSRSPLHVMRNVIFASATRAAKVTHCVTFQPARREKNTVMPRMRSPPFRQR